MDTVLNALAADIGLSVRALRLIQKIAAHHDDRYSLARLSAEEAGPLHHLTTYGAVELVYGHGIMAGPTEVKTTKVGLLVVQSIGLATAMAALHAEMDHQRADPALHQISPKQAEEAREAFTRAVNSIAHPLIQVPAAKPVGTYSVSSQEGKFWLVYIAPDLGVDKRIAFPTRKLADAVADELNGARR